VFDGYFTPRNRCLICGVTLERKEGYFLGGCGLNLVGRIFLGLGLAIDLLFKSGVREFDLIWQEVIAVALAVALPLILCPFSQVV
jgi:uncharacterized protein (DUF983 family)